MGRHSWMAKVVNRNDSILSCSSLNIFFFWINAIVNYFINRYVCMLNVSHKWKSIKCIEKVCAVDWTCMHGNQPHTNTITNRINESRSCLSIGYDNTLISLHILWTNDKSCFDSGFWCKIDKTKWLKTLKH